MHANYVWVDGSRRWPESLFPRVSALDSVDKVDELLVPERRMIWAAPQLSAVARTSLASQKCFCDVAIRDDRIKPMAFLRRLSEYRTRSLLFDFDRCSSSTLRHKEATGFHAIDVPLGWCAAFRSFQAKAFTANGSTNLLVNNNTMNADPTLPSSFGSDVSKANPGIRSGIVAP